MNTLADYFDAAGITNYNPWANRIEMALDPMPHQVTGLTTLALNIRSGLYDDVGVGKTLPLQAMMLFYLIDGANALVIMPPSLLYQFKESLYDNFPNFDAPAHILDESKAKRQKLMTMWGFEERWPRILLLSYDVFRMLGTERKQKGWNRNKETGERTPKIVTQPVPRHPLRKNYQVILCDEAHKLKSPESWSHVVLDLYVEAHRGDDTDYALHLATGTPIGNTLVDAYGLIHLITPDAYADADQFDRFHVIRNIYEPYSPIIGYDQKDLLHRNLYKYARRVVKKDVLKDLPPLSMSPVPVKLSGPHGNYYRKVLRKKVLELSNKEEISLENAAKLRQVAGRLVSDPEAFEEVKGKVKNEMYAALEELLDSINPAQKKIIIFCHYRNTVELLADKLSKWKPAVIYGGSSDKDRARRDFLNDDGTRLLIANIKSASEGLNLQDVCSNVIFFECPSVPSQVDQAVARVDRKGQKVPTVAYLMYARGTVYQTNYAALLEKDEEIKKVVSHYSKEDLLRELML